MIDCEHNAVMCECQVREIEAERDATLVDVTGHDAANVVLKEGIR